MDFRENWEGGGGPVTIDYFKLEYGCLLPHPIQSTNFFTIQGYVGNVS